MNNASHHPTDPGGESRWITREDFEPDRARYDDICLARLLGKPLPPPLDHSAADNFSLWSRAWSYIRGDAQYDAHELKAARLNAAGVTWVELVDPTSEPAVPWVLPLTDQHAVIKRGRKSTGRGTTSNRAARPSRLRTPASFLHPPFSDRGREGMVKLQTALDDVCPRSAEAWEARFRDALCIRTEIARWDLAAQAYMHVTSGIPLSASQRVECLGAILWALAPNDPAYSAGVRLRTLTLSVAAEICRFVTRNRVLTLPGPSD